MSNKAILDVVPKDELHALRVVAEMARNDYIAVHSAMLNNLTPSDEWDAAVEALDA